MSLAFPTSPAVNQTYTSGSRIWRWNGAAWEAVINAGQVVSVFVSAGPFVDTTDVLAATVGRDWTLLTYI